MAKRYYSKVEEEEQCSNRKWKKLVLEGGRRRWNWKNSAAIESGSTKAR